MKYGSLFSGIGGLDLGLDRAGMSCAWQVEKDGFCTRVLTKHWPNVPKFRDVRDVGDHNLEPVDVVAGGFPCQDVSVAGKRAGMDGERSGLWREFARIIGELRPRFVLVENVTGLLDGGIGRVLGDLAERGYDAEWTCLPAAAFGAPHQRERIFLVAYPGGEPGRRCIFPDQHNDLPRDSQWRSTQGIKTGRGWKRWLGETCAALDRADHNPWFRGMDDGVFSGLDRSRMTSLGNAVVPQVAEYIGRRILEVAR